MTQPPRQFTLKDMAPASIAYGSACRQAGRRYPAAIATFGTQGVVLPEGGFEAQEGVREWLRHLEAGRIG